MADNRQGRDKQARDAANRRELRYMRADLERGDEPEPAVDEDDLGNLQAELGQLEYPAPATDILDAVGSHEVATAEGTYTVAALLPASDAVVFEDPDDVRVPIQRPTIAAAMKRVVEAADEVPQTDLGRSQGEAYEKTFRALKAIDADDDDEGIQVIGDWIVERIRETGKLPGSRDVRRQSATFCRANGYEIRTDEWLGV